MDYYLNKFALIDGKTQANKRNKTQSDKKSTIDIKKQDEPPKMPHFQMPPIYEKERFCSEMPEEIWAARDSTHSDKIGLSALFYLNLMAFDLFNDPLFCDPIWENTKVQV